MAKVVLSDYEIGMRLAKLENMYVPNVIADLIVKRLARYHQYILAKNALRDALPEYMRRVTRTANKVLVLMGPTGTGKSAAFRHFIAKSIRAEDAERGVQKILEVDLRSTATVKTMYGDILRSYKDKAFEQGTKSTLENRVDIYRTAAETEMFIFDETNHMINRDGGQTRWSVADEFKSMAETAVVGIVLVGILAMEDILLSNKQLGMRSELSLKIAELNVGDAAVEKKLRDFYKAYADEMVKLGIVSTKPDLGGDLFGEIVDVSGGFHGTGARFIQAATDIAFQSGASAPGIAHFRAAKELWGVAQGIVSKDGHAPARRRPAK